MQSHIDDVIGTILEIFAERDRIRGLVIEEAAPRFRRFTARLREVD